MGKRNKFKEINYIELYSGPGIYFNRETGIEADGSPLIAIEHNFDNMFFNDISEESIAALKERAKRSKRNVFFSSQDANIVAESINDKLSNRSINFCFLDPDNMGDLKFQSVKDISRNRRVDLLINFPYVDYRRSVHVSKEKFDDFFGTQEWRVLEDRYSSKNLAFRASALIDLYMRQLVDIGYCGPEGRNKGKNYIPIYNTKRNLLYYLVYASKHQLGYRFCSELKKYAISQQELELN
jgi:three-Cys-motif partner protein